MHRRVIRGDNTQERRRGKSERFGNHSLHLKRKISNEDMDLETNYIGNKYAEDILGSKSKIPSMKQIRDGLGTEAEFQIKRSMGNI